MLEVATAMGKWESQWEQGESDTVGGPYPPPLGGIWMQQPCWGSQCAQHLHVGDPHWYSLPWASHCCKQWHRGETPLVELWGGRGTVPKPL